MPAISVMLKPRVLPLQHAVQILFLSLPRRASASAPSHGMMSEETLKNVIAKALDYADGAPVALSFQGGEPLLAGKGFFVKAEELIRTLNVKTLPP